MSYFLAPLTSQLNPLHQTSAARHLELLMAYGRPSPTTAFDQKWTLSSVYLISGDSEAGGYT